MEERDEEYTQLVDGIYTKGKMICDKCPAEEMVGDMDTVGACDYFYRIGWRKPRKITYCPDCSKKYLKQ